MGINARGIFIHHSMPVWNWLWLHSHTWFTMYNIAEMSIRRWIGLFYCGTTVSRIRVWGFMVLQHMQRRNGMWHANIKCVVINVISVVINVANKHYCPGTWWTKVSQIPLSRVWTWELRWYKKMVTDLIPPQCARASLEISLKLRKSIFIIGRVWWLLDNKVYTYIKH